MKTKVFLFDCEDVESGEWYSLEDALSEDFLVIEDDMLLPYDCSTVVYHYEDKFVESEAVAWVKIHMTLTDFQKKALWLILRRPGITARQFGEKMWPDSVAHLRMYNGGHGAAAGKGAWLSAGSHIGKLKRKGWVRDRLVKFGSSYEVSGYEVTPNGKYMLCHG